jgi:3-dehydroquinate dehydratase type I
MAAVKNHPFCEIRIDLLNFSSSQIGEIFTVGEKLVATCRSGTYDDNVRKKLLVLAIREGAAFVDIDLKEEEKFRFEILEEAKNHLCKSIISYHNYFSTPAIHYLEKIALSLFDKGADIAKIACLVKGQNDLSKLYQLYSFIEPLIAFGMGEEGTESRIKSIELGAPFSYASLNSSKETAPGQITYAEMKYRVAQISEGQK